MRQKQTQTQTQRQRESETETERQRETERGRDRERYASFPSKQPHLQIEWERERYVTSYLSLRGM